VLDKDDIAFDVFWSSLDSGHITNRRSGENGIPINSTEFALIRPCVFSVISQSVIAPAELLLYKQARDGASANTTDVYGDGFSSVSNLLGAFHSMRTLDSMISSYSKIYNFTYDAVIVLRPDTAVISDIDVSQHLAEIIQKNKDGFAHQDAVGQPIWIPDFEHWGGFNDRGAFGSARVMSHYLLRGAMYRDYVGPGRILGNGEKYLKAYLDFHNISMRPSALRVIRVRADHSIAEMDVHKNNLNLNDVQYAKFKADCLIKIGQKHYINASHC
jgi:hypothetical protein